MRDVFDAVFQSFWTFSGTVILLGMFGSGLVELVRAIRGKQ